MAKRLLLAGLLGGLAMFAWESVAHMLLPLGDAGIQALGNEQAVMAALKDNIKEPGFYFFPAPDIKPGMTSAQRQEAMRKAEEKWRAGPSGIMIIHPNGEDSLSVRQFVTQFGTDVAAMLLAAILLTPASGLNTYGKRVSCVALLGLLPTLCTEIPYWNWYGFPTVYVAAQFIVHLIGFCVGGLVVARFIKAPVPE